VTSSVAHDDLADNFYGSSSDKMLEKGGVRSVDLRSTDMWS